jgi:hypothetical protein
MNRALEIAVTEGETLAPNADLDRLCPALLGWSVKLRILENEERRRT